MLASFIYGKRERYIDLSCNLSGVMECTSCGVYNIRDKRIDTESVWGSVDSYCLGCWWIAVRKAKDYKMIYRYLGMSNIL